MFTWDPSLYLRHAGHRSRPFFDLTSRIEVAAPRRVVDLGCGPGNLTVLLAQRWPEADVLGIDSSPEMIDQARALGSRVRFEVGDVSDFRPAPDMDVVISSATLQWVPDHPRLIRSWLDGLPAGGVLAWQVPGNFTSPSYTLLAELAASPRWSGRTGPRLDETAVLAPAEAAELLLSAGWLADCWESTYVHVLTGPDPVLEWISGTGLRPVLAGLPGAERDEFRADYAELLREAYPSGPGGTLFPFRRIFAVGTKP